MIIILDCYYINKVRFILKGNYSFCKNNGLLQADVKEISLE